MEDFARFTIAGLFLGGVYALVALGIVFVYKSTKVFNFSQGWMVMIGAFMVASLIDMFGVVAGIIGGLVFGALFGLAIERLLMRPMIGQPLIAALLMTIMLAYVWEGITILGWGTDPRTLPLNLPGEPITIGGVVIRNEPLWGFGAALLFFLIFSWFYWRTMVGRSMRAVAEDHQVAQSMGIPVRITFSISWLTAGLLCVLAGIFMTSVTDIHYLMWEALMPAIAVCLLGGLDSVAGAIVGGMILGLLTSLIKGYVHPALGEAAPFMVMLLILLVKPYGLWGLVRIERL